MSESKLAQAPRLGLDADNKVIDRNTGKQLQGIAVFGTPRAVELAETSPFAAMQQWSALRQSGSKPSE